MEAPAAAAATPAPTPATGAAAATPTMAPVPPAMAAPAAPPAATPRAAPAPVTAVMSGWCRSLQSPGQVDRDCAWYPFTDKLKEVEEICNPVITAMYQAAGAAGAPPGA